MKKSSKGIETITSHLGKLCTGQKPFFFFSIASLGGWGGVQPNYQDRQSLHKREIFLNTQAKIRNNERDG